MGKILNMQDNYDKSCYECAEDELINGTINATSGNSERRQDGEMASRNKFMRHFNVFNDETTCTA